MKILGKNVQSSLDIQYLNNMPKIILCRGIQGSGKTTFAKQWVLEDPEHRIRFSYDDLRNMMGKYWVPSREKILQEIKRDFILSTLGEYDIIIDNMNLNPEELKFYQTAIAYTRYVIEFKDFFIPLEVCIDRDSKRENPIGEEVIRKTYEKYKSIIENG